MTLAAAFTCSSSLCLSQSLLLRRRSASLIPNPSLSLSFTLPPPPPPDLRFSLQSLPRSSASDVGRQIEFEPQGGDGFGGGDQGSGNGGGGGGGEGFEEEEEEDDDEKKKMGGEGGGMLMSQKFTLAYAALVGVGGVMGFVKKGSMKSAAAGGLSSLLLYYVYTQLPTNPTFASSLGLGISGALLAVMGSRFKKSGKIFPAGVVSLVSLFMTGGYLHAILRAGH